MNFSHPKIGDMVRYTPQMTGLQNCFGIVIGFDGAAVEVQWTNIHYAAPPLDSLSGWYTRTRGKEISTELRDFLEVVSEAR